MYINVYIEVNDKFLKLLFYTLDRDYIGCTRSYVFKCWVILLLFIYNNFYINIIMNYIKYNVIFKSYLINKKLGEWWNMIMNVRYMLGLLKLYIHMIFCRVTTYSLCKSVCTSYIIRARDTHTDLHCISPSKWMETLR